MDGARGEHLTPGQFRRSQNRIGPPASTIESARFVPPPVEEMHSALDDLKKELQAFSDLPALVQAAMIDYQSEAIHPFLDGNGRNGRLLIILLLIELELVPQPCLYLSANFEIHASACFDHLLAVSQEGEWEGGLAFFLEGVQRQSEDAIDRIEGLRDSREESQGLLQVECAAEPLGQAVDVLFEWPNLSLRQLDAAMEVPC